MFSLQEFHANLEGTSFLKSVISTFFQIEQKLATTTLTLLSSEGGYYPLYLFFFFCFYQKRRIIYSYKNRYRRDKRNKRKSVILLVFGQASGLKINLEKNTISGTNTRQELLSSLVSVLDCKV